MTGLKTNDMTAFDAWASKLIIKMDYNMPVDANLR